MSTGHSQHLHLGVQCQVPHLCQEETASTIHLGITQEVLKLPRHVLFSVCAYMQAGGISLACVKYS